ncbi:hypothetical protein GINT2_000251 [Glugoides intestinalis]
MLQLGEYTSVGFNIAKACIGSGIYAYPHVFNSHGVVPTFLMTVASGIAAVLGTYIYINCNQRLGKGNSIATLGAVLISNKFKYFVDFVVILKCLAVGAGYLNLARELTNAIIPAKNFKFLSKYFSDTGFIVTGVGCILLMPSMLSSSLGRLRYLSYFGTACIILLVILSTLETSGRPRNFELFPSHKTNILDNIGIFVFGFNCHQSILTIHNETALPSRVFKSIVTAAFILVASLYLFFGFINYSAFFSINQAGIPIDLKKIFTMWDQDHLITKIAYSLFILTLLITVPFQIHPAKSCFIDIFNIKSKKKDFVCISMILICYFFTTRTWYDFSFVANYVTKPFNSFLCFGYPILYLICNDLPKSYFDFYSCIYLSIFMFSCFISYFI